jgi:acyl-CoA thioesterase
VSTIPNRERLDALFRADPYLAKAGADLVSWGPGRASVRWTPDGPRDGPVRAGEIFTAADLALSVAGNSWGRFAVAQTVQIHYLSGAEPGEPLIAKAVERARSRRTASYLIEVRDEDNRLVASAHAMGYRTSKWLLGEDVWPEGWRAAH